MKGARQATKTSSKLCEVWDSAFVDEVITHLILLGKFFDEYEKQSGKTWKGTLLDKLGFVIFEHYSNTPKELKKDKKYWIPSKTRDRLVYRFPHKYSRAFKNRKKK